MFDPSRRSLRIRLAGMVALLTCVLMGGGAFYVYSAFRQAIERQTNREVTASIKVLIHKLDEDHDPVNKELLDVGEHLSVRITDISGKVLLQSLSMEARVPAASFPAQGEGFLWQGDPRLKRMDVKLASARYQGGWIQVLRDMGPETRLLTDLRWALLPWLLLVPFLAAGLGYLIARAGLQPIQDLVGSAQSIHPDSLDTRFEVEGLPLEIQPLAQAMNTAMERLALAFSKLGELNADLAHELRTPVHVLRLEAESILGRKDLPPDLAESMANMMETLEHLSTLIEQMLMLARIEDPSRHIEKASLDLRDLLRQVAMPFLSLAEEKGVHVELTAGEGHLVHADRTLLRRALHNLLANAIRHSPPGSMVELKVVEEHGRMVVEVRDQGEGIPQCILDQLGKRFVKSSGPRDRPGGGLGLGLSIAQGIAKVHGASLHFQSEAGVGTVAKITFPAS